MAPGCNALRTGNPSRDARATIRLARLPVHHAGKVQAMNRTNVPPSHRLSGQVQERARFLRSFLSGPRRVGAVLPTSRYTARLMIDMAPVRSARCVVELGAGTGPLTKELVPRLGPESELLAFEIDPTLARVLETELTDPRVRVIADSAANLEAHLDGKRPEVIFSALPFTSLPVQTRDELLDTARRMLADDGVMVVLQYSPVVEGALRAMFSSVQRRLSLPNVPPAFLYACRPSRMTNEEYDS